MAKLVVEKVDDDLQRRFKIFCINNGTNMRAEIIKMIERRLKQAEKAESK